MAKKTKAPIEEYINEYKVEIIWSKEDNAFIASAPELPGCVTHGESQEEALKMAHEAIESYLLALQDKGREIPEPLARKNLSGKIALRISPQLHGKLASQALIANMSLNALIEEKLRA